MRLTPCYSLSQVVSICQSFRPLTPFFFLTKVPFLAFFLEFRKVWPYRHAYDVPLVTLIQNIYGFVGLASFFFSGKCTILHFFKYRKWCGHIDMLMTFPLVTLILNIYGFVV